MQLPPVLYKYQAFTPASVGNLTTRQIWFSRPMCFNDPFDCAIRADRGAISDSDFARLYQEARSRYDDPASFDAQYSSPGANDPTFRDGIRNVLDGAWEKRKLEMRHSRGVCCFSEKSDDIVMWSHYADAHKGFCLAFRTDARPFSSARPVHYATDLPALNPTSMLLDDDESAFWAMILTKFDCWSYEKEWRAFHKEADRPFGYEKGVLQSVYFGVAMPKPQQLVIGKLLDGTGTQLYQMRRDPIKFAVVPQSTTFTPTS